MSWSCKKLLCGATNVHTSTIFFYKFGATAMWKMTKICSNYVRQHTTSLWDHYVARISFEVDQHLTVHDLGRTIWSHNLKCRTTHVAPTIHTTTRFRSHNHVVPSRTTKFLSVWTHLYTTNVYTSRFFLVNLLARLRLVPKLWVFFSSFHSICSTMKMYLQLQLLQLWL